MGKITITAEAMNQADPSFERKVAYLDMKEKAQAIVDTIARALQSKNKDADELDDEYAVYFTNLEGKTNKLLDIKVKIENITVDGYTDNCTKVTIYCTKFGVGQDVVLGLGNLRKPKTTSNSPGGFARFKEALSHPLSSFNKTVEQVLK